MQANRAALASVVAILLLAGVWLYVSRTSNVSAVRLLSILDSAEKQPAAGAFEVIEADLNGERKPALSTPPASRLKFKVMIPDDAWLRVAVGTKPESWTQEGNGVLFFVGISDGRTFDDLFSQHVNPFSNPGDRRWIQVWVDLSPYAGEEVELILNTRGGPDKEPDDMRNDQPLWGDPEIVVR